jgi:protease II
LIITNVGNQMKDYAIMRVAEKDVGSGREHWQTVLSPSPGTQIEDVDVFSSHIIWYGLTPSFPLDSSQSSHPFSFQFEGRQWPLPTAVRTALCVVEISGK